MVQQYVYAPHYDFYINKIRREHAYNMDTFHLHKKYEVYYQISGTRTYFIDDSAYLIQPGNLVLIDKDVVHKTGSPDENPHVRIVLNFNEEYISPIAERLEGLNLFEVFRTNIKVLMLDETQQAFLENLLNRLLAAKSLETPAAVAMRRLQLCELLLFAQECAELQNQQNPESPEISNQIIKNITHYIATNYKEQLNLQTIAEKFQLSTYYLSRLFKRINNMSMTEYVNSVRLREAKVLLESTNLHIEEISEAVGYNTTTHFTRTFKTGTGTSPQTYRKLYRNHTN